MLSEDQKKRLAQGKENSPVEAPRASTSKICLNKCQTSPENPKDQPEGKGKAQVEQALPTELQHPQEREESHGQPVQYGKDSDGNQKQGRGNIEPIFPKDVDLVNLLGNEILKVKESQMTIIGLENVNKDNILSLAQIYAIIESKVTLLNQPDDNSISFITRKLKELRIQAQDLENSTGENAALFQKQLEKRDKARLELKEDIQSSTNNISLKNSFPRQSTPILTRNVLNLNN
ncbi:hypothetical protein O181_130030 [Austropuccinia psidii MF-1]|uniref:Uncharacterized protein n=1 Tax=Austropuccinia psidii MF-1 TaxID=1389203 RepID=A0A9Q3QAK0_9BASI|nr:hypothetical protein [Austropuccinia psidii MF-1]